MFDVSYLVAGIFTGLIVGLTGVGGGALMTPLLLIIFGIPPITAVATDLLFAAITKIFGALTHHKFGQIDWPIVRRLWIGSLSIAALVVCLLNFGSIDLDVDWLISAIGSLVLLTSIGLIFFPKLKEIIETRDFSEHEMLRELQPTLTVIAGGLLGFCVALTSVGAGALGALVLLYLYPKRMNPHRLVGTDIAHAIPLALISGGGYLLAGKVDLNLLANLLIGSIPATIFGSLMAQKLNSRLLQIFLAFVLMASGIKLIF